MNFLTKPRKPIPKISAKRQVQVDEYFNKGQLLNDTAHFLAVCRGCHQKIELSPLWAKENGYSEKRN